MNYAVVEIKGKQYKVLANKPFLVNLLDEEKSFDCDKVLLVSDDKELKIGSPYLKDKLNFEVLGQEKGKKIRVAKFHAKANYRRVTGSRQKFTKIVLKTSVKKA